VCDPPPVLRSSMAMTGPSLRTVYAFWNSAILIDRLQVWVPVFGGGGGAAPHVLLRQGHICTAGVPENVQQSIVIQASQAQYARPQQ
jgi:hypothetical protein